MRTAGGRWAWQRWSLHATPGERDPDSVSGPVTVTTGFERQASLPELIVCRELLLIATLCGLASGLIGMATVSTP
ncbi:hypothetical protein BH23ACT10_BH23ACT10_27720 [soil metagenome]